MYIREWVSVFFGFRAAEGEKALAEVVEAGEEHHAGKQGHVVARAHRGVGKQAQTQRLGSAVSDQVAHGDVRREAHDLSHAALAAAEREVFVEEEAQNTCQHVIGRRGHPVRAPGNITLLIADSPYLIFPSSTEKSASPLLMSGGRI